MDEHIAYSVRERDGGEGQIEAVTTGHADRHSGHIGPVAEHFPFFRSRSFSASGKLDVFANASIILLLKAVHEGYQLNRREFGSE